MTFQASPMPEEEETNEVTDESPLPIEKTVTIVPSIQLQPSAGELPLNPDPPAKALRLVFIHHSTGEDWLNPDGGNLRQALNENDYYVTDTNYDWGPPDQDVQDGNPIGYHTDIGHWYNWFLGAHRDAYLQALYSNSHVSEAIGENTEPDPGGENTVVLY